MDEPRFLLRLFFGRDQRFGPGKADLLRGIAEEGSISAAGKRMGMSYKRAWGLVEAMNADFARPLVESTRGGPKGGGARLTDEGAAVLADYTRLAAKVAETGAPEIAAIAARLKP
ncbi:winged helix-turn-helix domain-containing protein [Frigidibacter sp. MR17.14]|uniref:winged helix-turn-helix domain-containing protein n=1 Tax=Frigidibacter sp. MR17.14 TaxID=3126509 RepID=UPI003012C722